MPYYCLPQAAIDYKLCLPLSQQALLGLMHKLLDDKEATSVVFPWKADCSSCIFWTGRYCERYRSAIVRKACKIFSPREDVVVLYVRKGEVLP